MFFRLAALVFAALAIVIGVTLIYAPAGIITAGVLAGVAALLYDDGGAQ